MGSFPQLMSHEASAHVAVLGFRILACSSFWRLQPRNGAYIHLPTEDRRETWGINGLTQRLGFDLVSQNPLSTVSSIFRTPAGALSPSIILHLSMDDSCKAHKALSAIRDMRRT
jgi:hypothetical protein